MKTSQIMIVAAMLVAVAFAGVVLSDDAEAVSAGEISAVSYSDGTYTTSEVIAEDAASIVIKDISDFSAMKQDGFEYWTVGDDGTPYYPGAQIAIAAIASSDLTDGVLTLKAHYTVPTDITFVVGDEEFDIEFTDAGSLTIPAGADDAIKAMDGKKFVGWSYNNQTYADLTAIKAIEGLAAGAVFTAVFEDVYDVSWVVDGTTIATGSTADDIAKPADPSKEHYTFDGWMVDENVVIKAGVDGLGDYEITEDTVFTASFTPVNITVTFMAGDAVVGTSLVPYGQTVLAPALPEGYASWDFDFSTPITEAITIQAVASTPEGPDTNIYVSFIINGETEGPYVVTDRFSIPNTDREGYTFLGWTVQGGDGSLLTSEQVQNYQYTEDVTFIANYERIATITYDVTIQRADGTISTIEVAEGAVAQLPTLGEGKVWALGDAIYDTSSAVTADITLKEVDEFNTVTFAVNGITYDAYTQEIRYGEKATEPSQFVFPAGYSGWNFDFSQTITADTVISAAPIPPAAEEPAFWETTGGQVALVLIAFVVIMLIAAYVMDYGGFKTKLKALLGRRKA